MVFQSQSFANDKAPVLVNDGRGILSPLQWSTGNDMNLFYFKFILNILSCQTIYTYLHNTGGILTSNTHWILFFCPQKNMYRPIQKLSVTTNNPLNVFGAGCICKVYPFCLGLLMKLLGDNTKPNRFIQFHKHIICTHHTMSGTMCYGTIFKDSSVNTEQSLSSNCSMWVDLHSVDSPRCC